MLTANLCSSKRVEFAVRYLCEWAIKSLEENQLIQFVGLPDRHFKKFVFKSDGVHEKIPLPPFSKGELEPKPVVKMPLPIPSKGELEPKPVVKMPLPIPSKGD